MNTYLIIDLAGVDDAGLDIVVPPRTDNHFVRAFRWACPSLLSGKVGDWRSSSDAGEEADQDHAEKLGEDHLDDLDTVLVDDGVVEGVKKVVVEGVEERL